MGIEIERKYLVDIEKVPKLHNGCDIKQGYIQTVDKTTVRVRIKAAQGYLTIKSANEGASRLEFEYPVLVDEANEMINKLCMKPIIEKTRYEILHHNHIWELDIFHGDNEGLIVAEVELKDEDEDITLPLWIKKEVTGDMRYYNSNLITNPYKNWK